MTESYQERFDHNQKESSNSGDRFGELFFDWWSEIWCKASLNQYADTCSIDDLQKELKEKFPYHIKVNKLEKSIAPLKECMTSEWTSYTWDNQMYAYFKTEEDKVKFILFST